MALATYFYVEEASPDAGRLTKDIDIVVRREDLGRIAEAAKPFGFQYRHVSGVDIAGSRCRNLPCEEPWHLVFAGEKVRPEYTEPVPELGEGRRIRGISLIPLEDLVRMKLYGVFWLRGCRSYYRPGCKPV